MLRLDRPDKRFSRLSAPSLGAAQRLERSHLQACIVDSSDEFLAEPGERLILVDEEITPSDRVRDRIDPLAVDPEGTWFVIEPKRGSDRLQMLRAIGRVGMISKWTAQAFRTRPIRR